MRPVAGSERRPEMRAHDEIVGRVDQQRRGQPPAVLVELAAERVGLLDRPREPVEQEAISRVRAREALEDHRDDHLVGDQLALLHVAVREAAELGPGRARGAQHVAGRDVREAEVRRQQRGLGALAGAGRAEQDEVEFRHRGRAGPA